MVKRTIASTVFFVVTIYIFISFFPDIRTIRKDSSYNQIIELVSIDEKLFQASLENFESGLKLICDAISWDIDISINAPYDDKKLNVILFSGEQINYPALTYSFKTNRLSQNLLRVALNNAVAVGDNILIIDIDFIQKILHREKIFKFIPSKSFKEMLQLFGSDRSRTIQS